MFKLIKPTSPGRRMLTQSKTNVYKGKPVKTLTKLTKNCNGRNSSGKITVKHKGGGVKTKLRIIDNKRNVFGVSKVLKLEHDPNRNAKLALLKQANVLYYIIAPEQIAQGDNVFCSKNPVKITPGNATKLENIPIGTKIFNIEMHPGEGGKISRAAGCFSQVYSKTNKQITITLHSGERKLFNAQCTATIGIPSNRNIISQKLGKAGRSRWLNIRPTVRGVAMNPVDHPHGGGEGKTSGGRHPVSPKGKPTKGKRTRNNKRTEKTIVYSRHNRQNKT